MVKTKKKKNKKRAIMKTIPEKKEPQPKGIVPRRFLLLGERVPLNG